MLSADKLFIGRAYENGFYTMLQFLLPLILVLPFCDIGIQECKKQHPSCGACKGDSRVSDCEILCITREVADDYIVLKAKFMERIENMAK